MPYINISTSKTVKDKKQLLEEITILISALTKKSKKFVMAKIEHNSDIYFGDESYCCFLEIKSIGSLDPSKIVRPICDFVNEKMGIPADKIYICFEDVSAKMWGWNGKTFA